MKKTEISKLKFLQYLAELKKLTPISVKQIAKDFKLGYASLCLEILERSSWIERVKEGNKISIRYIGEVYPDPQLAKFLHIQLREELEKRYPDKYSKKKSKIARAEEGERILVKPVTAKEAFSESIKLHKEYTDKEKAAFKEALNNSNGSPQLLLPLNDLSSEEQKQKEAIQRIKINLLTALNKISADFQKRINDIAKEINSINSILVLLFAGSVLLSSCGSGDPVDLIYVHPVDTLTVKFTQIDSYPDSLKATYNDFDKIISGEQLTDIVSKEARKEVYILLYHKLAQEEQKKYGVPASITLAQGLLESGAGESKLAKQNNNHFGIKCFSKKCKKGHCTNFTDDSHKDFFMKYKSVKESFRAHSLFLQRDRYKPLKKCKNHKDYAHGLKSCGYATDPKYAYKLIRIINDHNLTQYDL